jgi:DNA repair exonuclease SbcCD ATPase subunit
VSGINNLSIDTYQQQLNQLNNDFSKIEGELKKLENDNQNVVTAYNSAKSEAQTMVDQMNRHGYKDSSGKVVTFKSLEDWQKAFATGGVYFPSGQRAPMGSTTLNAAVTKLQTATAAYNNIMGPTLEKLKAGQEKLDTIGRGLKESIGSLQAMGRLLQSGDIEGSVMLLQTTRAKGLEGQLGSRIAALQSRNAEIKARSDLMAEAQKHQFDKVNGKDPDDTEKGRRAGEISTMKNAIDQLNSDSQLDMIGIQGLVNKRNEAFDTLTNLLGKFQKTIDGIVSNMR